MRRDPRRIPILSRVLSDVLIDPLYNVLRTEGDLDEDFFVIDNNSDFLVDNTGDNLVHRL